MVKRGIINSGSGAPKRRLALGVFLGILIGLGVAIAVTFYVNRATHDVIDSSGQSKTEAAEEEVEFTFYDVLLEGDRASDPIGEDGDGERTQRSTIFFIQVAALSNARAADNLKARLAMSGFESRIQSVETVDEGLLHRVRIGPYYEVSEVDKIKAALVEFNFDVTVIKVKDDN
ncbi:MAG: SPOR domain-containing protein [Proteobacteria bacterium]|nr:SPOR domain-containing protein [Pseudomonadota bacterium]